MDVFMTANLKSFEDFLKVYQQGDEQKLYRGKSALSYALSNPKHESRYQIANFLLDRGAVLGEIDSEGNTALHLLLGAGVGIPDQDAALASRLIQRGVSAATPDKMGTIPFLYILTSKFSDAELTPLYDLWLEQPDPGLEQYSQKFEGNALDVAGRYPDRNQIISRLKERIDGSH
jgi:ankyrin repeat protein